MTADSIVNMRITVWAQEATLVNLTKAVLLNSNWIPSMTGESSSIALQIMQLLKASPLPSISVIHCTAGMASILLPMRVLYPRCVCTCHCSSYVFLRLLDAHVAQDSIARAGFLK